MGMKAGATAKFLIMVVTGLAILATPASAATITLGAPAPAAPGACAGCSTFQYATGTSSPSYTVPAGDWTVMSWTVRGSGFLGSAQLRIFRETATPDLYVVVADSASETVPANTTPTFATSIPVQPGDVIGLRTGNDIQPNYAGNTGDLIASVLGDPAVGQTTGPGGDTSYATNSPFLTNVGATLTSPDPPAPTPETPVADTASPDTTITEGPSGKTKKKTATFAFSGTDARTVASFQCKLDSGSFESCTSPKTYSGLKKGSHTVAVRAVDAAGNVDPTPATRTWKVKRKRKKK